MTKSTPRKLEYMKAYNNKPERIEAREAANRARASMIRAGKARVGDGKDVAHIKALDSGGTTSPGNIKMEPRKENRDWRKGRKGYTVGVDK